MSQLRRDKLWGREHQRGAQCCFVFPSRADGTLWQHAAVFVPHWIGIEWINRAFKEGASKLASMKTIDMLFAVPDTEG